MARLSQFIQNPHFLGWGTISDLQELLDRPGNATTVFITTASALGHPKLAPELGLIHAKLVSEFLHVFQVQFLHLLLLLVG